MTVEMFKAHEQDGIEWLHPTLNGVVKVMAQETLSQDLKEIETLELYKQRGDAMHCENYRGIKTVAVLHTCRG